MNAAWSAWVARFEALALRERRLIAVAAIGGTLLLGWTLAIEPSLTRLRLVERGQFEVAAQRSTLQEQLVSLQVPALQPETKARAELAALREELGRLNARFAVLEGTLVPPQRMTGLLEEMIGRRTNLRLVSLRTLPVKPMLEAQSGEMAKAGETRGGTTAALYKHGVEIKLEGGYAELAEYLARLEKSGQQLLWERVSLSAEQHPRLVLTLTVYTLSLDRAWLIT